MWRKGDGLTSVFVSSTILRNIVTVIKPRVIFHSFLSDLSSKELTDRKSPVPFPVFLPVNYDVRDADYLFLKEAGQDFMRNSSMQSHTQPFVILRASRQPAVNASYGTMSTEQLVPLDLVQSVQLFDAPEVFTFNWKIQAFALTPRVFSSKPKVRVLFYVAGRDWGRGEGAVDELPCVTVYAFWQTQEVRGLLCHWGARGEPALPSWLLLLAGLLRGQKAPAGRGRTHLLGTLWSCTTRLSLKSEGNVILWMEVAPSSRPSMFLSLPCRGLAAYDFCRCLKGWQHSLASSLATPLSYGRPPNRWRRPISPRSTYSWPALLSWLTSHSGKIVFFSVSQFPNVQKL